jgi:UDP-glucuronate decarboxylase
LPAERRGILAAVTTSVVTGGAGFLGSHLCEHLLANGHRVLCLDNLETASLQNIEHIRGDNFVFVHHDVMEPISIEEPVDLVFHLAAIPSPIDYLRLPLLTLKIGSYGTHNALGLAKWKRARFVLASTSEVYGDPQIHPQPESYWGNVNPVGPRGVYDEAKRYSEAMTMAYHRQQGVDTAIARIFNSILADEQVLFDDGRELRREPISEVAMRVATRAVAAGYVAGPPKSLALLDPGFSAAVEYPLEGVSVPSFTPEGRIVSATAESLIAHPTSQRCYEIRTRYGRSIRVTGDHSVFTEGPDGEPEAREVNELGLGDRIALARRIDVPERDRTEIDMLDVWRFAEEDPWNLCVEASGLGQLAWANRFDLFGLLVTERRNAGPNWRNGAWTKLIRMRETDRVPLPVVPRLVDELPPNALVRIRSAGRSVAVPAKIKITDDLLWLLGLWVAEGSWHESPGNAFLTISCEDHLLERAAAVVKRELGLHVVRVGATPARGPAIFVHSKLLLRLMEYLGFGGNRKRIPGWILGLPLSRLKWFLEGYREGDGVHSGLKLKQGMRHEFSTVHEELKDDLLVAFARFGLVASVGRYRSRFRKRTGDREYPFWRLTLANVNPWSPLDWDAGVEQRLNARCTADLVWAPVTSIEEIPATPLVYDFSVPGNENFWAGSGVMAHNTYGPRMRRNDGRAIPTFVRQALENKPLTIFGEGSQTRSFCYVDDLIKGMYLLATSEEHMPINLGNPREFTILELAETVIRVTGSGSEIVHEALPIDDPQTRQPDITLAKEILGWNPEIELEEGLRRMLPTLGREPVSV